MEKFFVTKDQGKGYIGEYDLSQIKLLLESKVLKPEYYAAKSFGLSWNKLMKMNSPVWIAISDLISNPENVADLSEPMPPVPVIDNSQLSFRKILFSFEGRINRQTFWFVTVNVITIGFIVGFLIREIITDSYYIYRYETTIEIITFLAYILLIPFAWISLAVQVKRWQDRNKSGWMVLINLIPVIGNIWAFIELGFLRGTIGTNNYGTDPCD